MIMEVVNTNNSIDFRCRDCFIRGFDRLLRKFNLSDDIKDSLKKFVLEQTQDFSLKMAPLVQRNLNREFIRLTGISDPYKLEKMESNRIAMDLTEKYKAELLCAGHHFESVVKLAIAGNVMDYGAFESFDVNSALVKALNTDLAINHLDLLYKEIQSANLILYLGDNAGEIAFDKLFIENCLSDKVVYAVKESPILNDVTFNDAQQIGMSKVAKVISNGYDAPSTILSECSDEFLDYFQKADVIISKGQGNLEGLLDENDPRIFFLLMVKCDVIAEKLNVPKDSFVVINVAYEKQ